ncbi:Serine/Threonine protein kinase, catalytic domain [Rhizoctonia solani]|uniref:cyclin-dependent kinase n=1 Tax=Rhizoctonia solani TaxID=456999 RepID=A0A8H7IE59_9AGAM|nr:Serine/Threonine protein kinase, catalytic domain [Rhizoctonia solani]
MTTPGAAGPSSPTTNSVQKRSKWHDIEEEPPVHIVPKKRAKKSTRVRESSPDVPALSRDPEAEVAPQVTARALRPAEENHSQSVSTRSRFVPPRTAHPPIQPCRSVYCYERLNHIEEGTYGVVFRARDKETGEIVALKKLKLDEEKNGFPITSLREVMALMVCKHEHVVGVREIVVGDTLTQVFIVMDFIEHDLKQLLTQMPSPFLQSEIKTLLRQLISAVAHCMRIGSYIAISKQDIWRSTRDMTQLVVTLWYRLVVSSALGKRAYSRLSSAPELLLGEAAYSTAVDMWSVGCIFGELLLHEPLFQAKGEMELLSMIFKLLGHPDEKSWPGFSKLPLAKTVNTSAAWPSTLRTKFPHLTRAGLDLLSSLLAYDPAQRISAEEALNHPYFSESPLPKHPSLFGSFPSVAAGEKRRKPDSPSAPSRIADYKLLMDFDLP